MKRTGTIVLLLAVMALGLVVNAGQARAQSSDANNLDFKSLHGLDTVYERAYTVDVQAIMASPGANPAEAMRGLFALDAIVLKFDNATNAKAGLDKLSGELEQAMGKGNAAAKLQREDLTGVGDTAFGYAGTMSQEGFGGAVYLAVAQKDKYIHVAIGISMGQANPKDDVVAFLKKMVDAKEGTDGITANDQGLNTGGLYDKLPLTGIPGKLKAGKGNEVFPKDESGALSGAVGVATPGTVATPGS